MPAANTNQVFSVKLQTGSAKCAMCCGVENSSPHKNSYNRYTEVVHCSYGSQYLLCGQSPSGTVTFLFFNLAVTNFIVFFMLIFNYSTLSYHSGASGGSFALSAVWSLSFMFVFMFTDM